jgi:hypothetical protein
MTPRTLLIRFSPFLVGYGLVLLCARGTLIPDRVIGWAFALTPPWRMFLSMIHLIFIIGFIGLCVLLIWKLPSRPIRFALCGLVLGHAYLGLDGLILTMGGWYFRPYLYSEMLTLLAIWHAYETSAALYAH